MKKVLIISACVIGILFAGITILFYYEFGDMILQIHAGQQYMKSLTTNDRSEWIARTTTLLETYPMADNESTWVQFEAPIDIKNLKILGIYVYKNEVRYIWAGGLEHTYLSVQRTPEGNFRFFANYNDEHSEELWPDEVNDNH